MTISDLRTHMHSYPPSIQLITFCFAAVTLLYLALQSLDFLIWFYRSVNYIGGFLLAPYGGDECFRVLKWLQVKPSTGEYWRRMWCEEEGGGGWLG